MGEITEAAFDELITAERSLARLDGVGEDLPNSQLLWAPLAKREALLSSKIENTIATADELVTAEAGEKPERQDVVEVTNYIRSLDYCLQSDLPICLRLIRGMHEVLLSDGVRGSEQRPGEFRTLQNYIGNEHDGFKKARFVPPPPGELLIEGLENFEGYANRKSYGIPKLAAIALMHYQFETLHPFRDGNGRIGRLLSALSLCRMGLLQKPFVYLSGYFEPHRDEYNDLMLRVSTKGDWLSWVTFFMKAIAHQAQDAEDRVRRLRSLRTDYRTQLSDANSPARINKLIDEIFYHPAVTAERTAKICDVTKPTARSYLGKLVEIGALSESPRNYRTFWFAREIINVINAPSTVGRYSSDPPSAQ